MKTAREGVSFVDHALFTLRTARCPSSILRAGKRTPMRVRQVPHLNSRLFRRYRCALILLAVSSSNGCI